MYRSLVQQSSVLPRQMLQWGLLTYIFSYWDQGPCVVALLQMFSVWCLYRIVSSADASRNIRVQYSFVKPKLHLLACLLYYLYGSRCIDRVRAHFSTPAHIMFLSSHDKFSPSLGSLSIFTNWLSLLIFVCSHELFVCPFNVKLNWMSGIEIFRSGCLRTAHIPYPAFNLCRQVCFAQTV